MVRLIAVGRRRRRHDSRRHRDRARRRAGRPIGAIPAPPASRRDRFRRLGESRRCPTFPSPCRNVVDDGYSVTNVYDGGVLLPFSAAVPDPRAPVELSPVARSRRLRGGLHSRACRARLIVPPGESDRGRRGDARRGARPRAGAARAGHVRGRGRQPQRRHRRSARSSTSPRPCRPAPSDALRRGPGRLVALCAGRSPAATATWRCTT